MVPEILTFEWIKWILGKNRRILAPTRALYDYFWRFCDFFIFSLYLHVEYTFDENVLSVPGLDPGSPGYKTGILTTSPRPDKRKRLTCDRDQTWVFLLSSVDASEVVKSQPDRLRHLIQGVRGFLSTKVLVYRKQINPNLTKIFCLCRDSNLGLQVTRPAS